MLPTPIRTQRLSQVKIHLSFTSAIDWLVLRGTAFSSGAVFLLTYLISLVGLDSIPANYLLPFLPGAVVGSWRFLTTKTPARMPFLTTILLSLAGIFWVRVSDQLDGILLAVSLIITMLVSMLFNSRERWCIAAKWFTLGLWCSAMFLLFDFVLYDRGRLGSVFYLGKRIIDPNLVAVLFTIGSLIQITLVWNFGDRKGRQLLVRGASFLLMAAVVALTGSRTALITIVFVHVTFFLFGSWRWSRWILAGIGLLAVPTSVLFFATQGTPDFLTRFGNDNASTFGGRFQIWNAAFERANDWGVFQAIFGEGTGGAPSAIGQVAPELADVLYTAFYSGYESGIPKINPHSSYVEWFLTFGTFGLLIGSLLLVNAFWNAFRVDRENAGATATAFLMVFLVTSVSLVAYRMVGVSIGCGAIALGYIYLIRDGQVR